MKWDWRSDLAVNSHRRGRYGAVEAFFLDPSFTFVTWLRVFIYLKSSRCRVVRFLSSLVLLHLHRSFSTSVSYVIGSVGVGLKVPHPLGMVLGSVNIGDNVTILQNVTIGRKDVTSEPDRLTSIGSGTVLSAGAVVLGPVDIGRNVVIGANAVVVKNLPEGVTAVGVPARIVRHSTLGRDAA